ncbi:hypothetical protein [Sulfurimonas sp.]
MNKKILKVVTASALVATMATSAMADESQFGVGVGVSNNTSTIRGTIKLENDLRLEPYFALSYVDPDNANATTNFEMGSALEVLQPINNKLMGYYGGYVGVASSDAGYGSTTTFNVGPVAGVEYALDPQFTLGAEVRADIGVGDATTVGTSSEVLLRYYFR